jgi:hypothetical protein
VRAILINPWDRTVTEVRLAWDGADYDALNRLINDTLSEAPYHTVHCCDSRTIGNDRRGNSVRLAVDDVGLWTPGLPMFTFEGADPGYQLAGRGLILGCNAEGETVQTAMYTWEIAAKVVWLDVETTGALEPSVMLEGEAAKEHARASGGMASAFADKVGFVEIVGGAVTAPLGTFEANEREVAKRADEPR